MPSHRPVIALAMGDPAGISPELTAKALTLREVRDAADFVVFGDRRVLDRGAKIAGVEVAVPSVNDSSQVQRGASVFVDAHSLDPDTVQTGVVSKVGGAFASANFRAALAFAKAGKADAVAFTPFNKQAMRLANPGYDDEIGFCQEALGIDEAASEFNVLEGLWNARVTSHVPLSGVAPLITRERILRSLTLTDRSMRQAGFATPRIAVAGLNPHAGDGGNFGREEIEVIGPAVEEGRARGILCEGPYPSDTVFLRAKNGAFDAVLTMYHDQGQIAMKLIGFDRGVTLLGGFPFPICTPAHGTAYDIAGRGIANIGATREALLLAARMGAASAQKSEAAAALN